MKCFLKYWLPLLTWLCVIFVGSTDLMSAEQTSRFLVPLLRWLKPDISTEALAQVHFFVRKLGHISEYAIFALLLWRALRSGTNLQMKLPILFVAAWILCGVFAATDEFHQSFVSSRTASPIDVMTDVCGALIGLAVCLVLARKNLHKI